MLKVHRIDPNIRIMTLELDVLGVDNIVSWDCDRLKTSSIEVPYRLSSRSICGGGVRSVPFGVASKLVNAGQEFMIRSLTYVSEALTELCVGNLVNISAGR
tara:strand:- start:278 stop:580 length:303 start_codon:yes stop_codon:yes gene_type:complete